MNTKTVAYRAFSKTEILKSSTWRELKAIHFSIKSFAKYLSNHVVLWHTDNFAVSSNSIWH